MGRVAEAELERHAAEHQGQQHHQDREIERRDDDGEGEREGGQQTDAAQDQPGLVAVPHRRDRVHDDVAGAGVRRQAVEHADAEIETVEQHVEEDPDAEDERPDRNEIEHLVHDASPSECSWMRVALAGRPLSIGESASGPAGPLRTMRAITRMPAGKMIRYTTMYPSSETSTSPPVSEGGTESAVRIRP